jgi:hypothetical protein
LRRYRSPLAEKVVKKSGTVNHPQTTVLILRDFGARL